MIRAALFRLQQHRNDRAASQIAMAVGLALIVAAAALRLTHTEALQVRAAEWQRELANKSKAVDLRRVEVLPAEIPTDAAWLDQFYRHFPVKERLPNLLRVMYREAEGQGLLLAEGSYQLVPLKDTQLAAYQISLPVKGSYTQIRQFVAHLLRGLPSAAVDELQFSRDAITNPQLEAKIRLTLYLRVNDVTH